MAKKVRGVFVYKSYSFRDKDPVIDELRSLLKDKGGITYKTFAAIHETGGPTATCLAGWFLGKTKRPQSATVEATGRAIGYKRVWQRMKMIKKGKYDKDPPFHRLTLDLDKDAFNKLKALAVATERSPSKQAKFMLMEQLKKTTQKNA